MLAFCPWTIVNPRESGNPAMRIALNVRMLRAVSDSTFLKGRLRPDHKNPLMPTGTRDDNGLWTSRQMRETISHSSYGFNATLMHWIRFSRELEPHRSSNSSYPCCASGACKMQAGTLTKRRFERYRASETCALAPIPRRVTTSRYGCAVTFLRCPSLTKSSPI